MEQTSNYDYPKYSTLDRLGDPCRSQCYGYSQEKDMPYNTSTIPLFSIIIPTYNESKNILELIQLLEAAVNRLIPNFC